MGRYVARRLLQMIPVFIGTTLLIFLMVYALPGGRLVRTISHQSAVTAVAFAEKHGMKLKALTPDQVADWRACSAGMLADYMNKVGDSARKVMNAYGRLRLDPCCSAAPGDAAFTRR